MENPYINITREQVSKERLRLLKFAHSTKNKDVKKLYIMLLEVMLFTKELKYNKEYINENNAKLTIKSDLEEIETLSKKLNITIPQLQ